MQKSLLLWGSMFACLGVVLGAFGAHALKAKLSPDQLQTFETGVKYQMYHALALILVFLVSTKINSPLINYSGTLMIIGTILFSGSIYLLSTRELLNIENWKFLGPVTPIGGFCLIAGWICLIIAAARLVKTEF